MQIARCGRRKQIKTTAGAACQALEARQLLSAATGPVAQPAGISFTQALTTGAASPTGFSPVQIRHAYGIDDITFGGVTGTGAGQTIAIVVAFNDPDFVDSTDAGFDSSDLHQFDVAMGLSDPPSFTKVTETGGTNYPGADPSWARETALDVEWTHAIAPDANIVLVETPSADIGTLVDGGVEYARTIPAVSVITMSFAVGEYSGELGDDSFIETPTGHIGITFVAASGDDGDVPQYPASSPNVLSVGATSLTLSGNNYSSETAHNTSGGGVSAYESKPSYQYGVTQSSTMRTTPDVAFDGDANTGVSVYDSYNGGSLPWYKIGGTSFSAPAWAGLIAIADQGRAQIDLGTLDGASQTLPRLYSLNSTDFHDVTSGSNGINAGAGYDLVTGLGTPIANTLISDLAGGNTVSGTVFNDANGNGTQNSGESGLAGFSALLDIYHTGTNEGADQEVLSNSNGLYQFTDLPGGTYRIVPVAAAEYAITAPSTYYTVTLGYGSSITGKNFGYKSTQVAEQVVFVQQPTGATAGTVITPAITVAVEDSSGNIVTGDHSTVILSIGSGSGTLGGTVSVNAVSGEATFSNIKLSAAGNYTLNAMDGSLASTTSDSFAIQAAVTTVAAAQLMFSQQPTATTAGDTITPAITVSVEDANGNVVADDTSAVTLSIASGTGTLGGTSTVNAVDGVATFSDITLSDAGDYTLMATDGSLTAATSDSVTMAAVSVTPVTPVTPVGSLLVFSQQPTAVNTGDVIAPAVTVSVEDSTGAVVSDDSSPVTLSIATGTGTLGGTLTQNAVNGVATFSDITISTAGAVTLEASDGSLESATSSSFTVSVPGVVAASITRSTLPSTAVAGTATHGVIVVNATNTASQTSTGMITANVFASSSDGTLFLIGLLTRQLSIKAGKAAVFSIAIKTLPSSLNGSYSLVAQIVDTTGNTLNSAAGPSLTVAAPLISLNESVTKLTLLPSVVSGSSSKATASVKITNGGNIPSTGTTTVGIYASPDGSSADATLIASISRKLVIRVGGSIVVPVPLKQIPASLTGSYSIITEVMDPNSNSSSASSGKTVAFSAPQVSLAASITGTQPASIAAGKGGRITVVLQNNGNIDSTGLASISVALSLDGSTIAVPLSNLLRTVRVPAGKSITLVLPFVIQATVEAASYFPLFAFSQHGNSVQTISSTSLSVT